MRVQTIISLFMPFFLSPNHYFSSNNLSSENFFICMPWFWLFFLSNSNELEYVYQASSFEFERNIKVSLYWKGICSLWSCSRICAPWSQHRIWKHKIWVLKVAISGLFAKWVYYSEEGESKQCWLQICCTCWKQVVPIPHMIMSSSLPLHLSPWSLKMVSHHGRSSTHNLLTNLFSS